MGLIYGRIIRSVGQHLQLWLQMRDHAAPKQDAVVLDQPASQVRSYQVRQCAYLDSLPTLFP